MAKSPLTYGLTCTAGPDADAGSADALCATLDDTLAADGWEKVAQSPGVAMLVTLHAYKPTGLRLTLTLTAPDGRTQQIDRALSVADATLSPAMQARFLQSLVAAIPSDF